MRLWEAPLWQILLITVIVILICGCSSMEYWNCYKHGEKVYSFPIEPLNQSNYDYCRSWKLNAND